MALLKRLGIWVAPLIIGGAATSFHAPLSIAPAIFVIFPCLVYLVDQALAPAASVAQRARRGFAVGWLFGYGYFFLGLLWLGEAYSVDPADAWKYPLLAFGFPIYLSIFYGTGFAIAGILWSKTIWRIFALGMAFFVGEWLRGWVLTGFPLMAVGEVLLVNRSLTQILALTGVAGANGIVPLFGCLPVVFLSLWTREKAAFGVAALIAVTIPVGAAGVRLQGEQRQAEAEAAANVRIVQSELPQQRKWNLASRTDNLSYLLQLSNQPRNLGRPTHVIWPETALAFFPEAEPSIVDDLMSRLDGQPVLVAGGMRTEQRPDGIKIFNSIFAGQVGAWSSIYDKRHLIPSEEFIPWRGMFEVLGIATWIIGPADYAYEWGSRSNVVSIPNAAPALAVICYEVLFADDILAAIDAAPARPRWMIVVSDNSWFSLTSGTATLLAQSRLRAAETGLTIVQAANHGISAIIEADGSVRQEIAVGKDGVIDAMISGSASGTFYSRNHRKIWWGEVGILLFCSLAGCFARESNFKRMAAYRP